MHPNWHQNLFTSWPCFPLSSEKKVTHKWLKYTTEIIILVRRTFSNPNNQKERQSFANTSWHRGWRRWFGCVNWWVTNKEEPEITSRCLSCVNQGNSYCWQIGYSIRPQESLGIAEHVLAAQDTAWRTQTKQWLREGKKTKWGVKL